jgi:hypothetical protein
MRARFTLTFYHPIRNNNLKEIAPPDAVDRGQIEGMGLTWPLIRVKSLISQAVSKSSTLTRRKVSAMMKILNYTAPESAWSKIKKLNWSGMVS